jgi:hypothetical protein
VSKSEPIVTQLSSPGAGLAGDVDIRQMNPLENPEWDAWLGTNPSASFFHGRAWAAVLNDTYGFMPVYFTASRAGILSSLLPVMEVNSWLTGRRGVSLPFTDQCAPLLPDAGSFQTLFREALNYLRMRGWNYLECRGGRSLLGDAPPSATFFGHNLNLKGDESELFSRCDGSARQAVRKAERSGLTIEFSQNLDAVRTFYELHCKTRKRLGALPQPFIFFQNIYRQVLAKNQGWVVLARRDSVSVAGAVFFHLGNSAIFKYGASDDRFQPLRANNLVMWEAIKRYSRLGFATLDLGRTSLDNDGLRRFKLGWGTDEYRIDYLKFDRRHNHFVSKKGESPQWHSRVMRGLPAPFSRLIGAALYKHAA